jgi:hypothetical protein
VLHPWILAVLLISGAAASSDRLRVEDGVAPGAPRAAVRAAADAAATAPAATASAVAARPVVASAGPPRRPHPWRGFVGRADLGWGLGYVDFDGAGRNGDGNVVWGLRAGHTVGSRWILWIEYQRGSKKYARRLTDGRQGSESWILETLTLSATRYLGRRGLYAHAGLGAGTSRVKVPCTGQDFCLNGFEIENRHGVAGLVAIGHEFPLRSDAPYAALEAWAATPTLDNPTAAAAFGLRLSIVLAKPNASRSH